MKYVLLLSLFGLFACEKYLPSRPTVINGMVVDENENPIPDVSFEFYGSEYKFWSQGKQTFWKNGTTNENGEFHVSQVIPRGTYNFQLNIDYWSPNFQIGEIKFSLNDGEYTPWGGWRFKDEYFGKEVNMKFKIVRL
ncbi:hypothetical protein SAMN06298216_1815 [Spirosomataceae bacterium TFI 002]|nr:hypothetical protein SAMN06298216_1815 [Spirosomataceae bacterium TFI 002]